MIFLAQLINHFFQVYTLILLARILASWFPELYRYRLMHFIVFITDPYLNVFRRFVPPLGMVDFSPVIAFLFLGFLQSLLINLLMSWGR